jgi:C-terminal processing protease CtpA/Prc
LEKFKQFLKEAFQKIQNSDTANLIIDIRENPGGSDLNANVLLEYLTAKPYRQFEEARIKISSQDEKGIAPLRQQNPELFEGKKVGDIITLELPLKTPPDNPIRFTGQTFLLIGLRSFSTSTSFAATIKRFDIGKLIGEETGDPTILYGNIVNVPLPNSALTAAIAGRAFVLAGGRPDGRGVLPDYEVKQKPEDTAKGIDTVLQFTLNLIQQSDPNGVLKKD